MPTRHPRIGVTKDPELARALEATRGLLDPPPRSEAAHVRALALAGAQAMRQGDGAAADGAAAYEQLGARPPRVRSRDFPWLDEQRVDRSNPLSRALDWVRGER